MKSSNVQDQYKNEAILPLKYCKNKQFDSKPKIILYFWLTNIIFADCSIDSMGVEWKEINTLRRVQRKVGFQLSTIKN